MFCAFFARRNKAKENQMKKKTLVYVAKGAVCKVCKRCGKYQDAFKMLQNYKPGQILFKEILGEEQKTNHFAYLYMDQVLLDQFTLYKIYVIVTLSG